MNPAEVHSQLIGCTVRLENSRITAVVTNFTTGDVPQLFVHHENGTKGWVEAKRGLAQPVDFERRSVPKIPYVEKKAHV